MTQAQRIVEPPVVAAQPVVNAMTVDVEDWFQVQALAHRIPRADWDGCVRRVEANVDRILELFDTAKVRATFFTLGWIAERHPAMVRRIVAAKHELASHGWEHIRAHTQDPAAFRADVERTRLTLEDIGGVPVTGYRAATFSIGSGNQWAFRVLRDAGYTYSSSVNPIRHDLYGMPDAPRTPFRPNDGALWEFPMTTVTAFGRNWPCSGGGFFRLLPYPIYRSGLAAVNRREQMAGIFYFHPWEIDPGQPRVAGCGWKSRVRHYTNLSRMQAKLERVLREFAWDRMDRVFADFMADNPTLPLSKGIGTNSLPLSLSKGIGTDSLPLPLSKGIGTDNLPLPLREGVGGRGSFGSQGPLPPTPSTKARGSPIVSA